MFGWHPLFALDAFLGNASGNEGSTDPTGNVQKQQNHLQYAYKLAAEASAKQEAQNKATYDRKVSVSKQKEPLVLPPWIGPWQNNLPLGV
jgi:hypothetical protein